MCGIEVANPILSKISGTILRTCQKCSAMGVEATEREKIGNKNYISDVMNKRSNRLREKEIKTEKILVEDFGILIKNGRENKKWSQKELKIRKNGVKTPKTIIKTKVSNKI